MGRAHDHAATHADDAEPRPRLRVLGVICDRCGHEAPADEAPSAGWHIAPAADQVVCDSCVAVLGAEIDGLILVFPVCGHLQEDTVLYDTLFCAICEG
jgi:hypothetical protein